MLNSDTINKFHVNDYILNKHGERAMICSMIRASDNDTLVDNAIVSSKVDFQQNLLKAETFTRFNDYMVTIHDIDESEWKIPLTSFILSELNHDFKLN